MINWKACDNLKYGWWISTISDVIIAVLLLVEGGNIAEYPKNKKKSSKLKI